jgi:hypothetical protein
MVSSPPMTVPSHFVARNSSHSGGKPALGASDALVTLGRRGQRTGQAASRGRYDLAFGFLFFSSQALRVSLSAALRRAAGCMGM